MLRKLLIIMLLLSTKHAWAQNNYEPYYKPSSYPKPIPKDTDKTDYRNTGTPLSDFRVVTLPLKSTDKPPAPDIPSRTITKADVKNDANLFLMLFNPTCGHCEDMTKLIEDNISVFKNSKILLVAAQHMGEYLVMFEKGLKTNDYPQIAVGLDSSHLIDRTFMYMSLPQINIYNKDRILIKRFSGEIPLDSLRQYVQ
ncbi:MAG: hypothetical protein BGO69_19140 [Bacteroidetes bacterium 46-16]|nr:MAG: hypothetical protein BGO69_19140 [Bacteroidetes bacterium 46-16]